jgi:hypothetical protein
MLTDWVDRHRRCLSSIPPKAGAIAFVKYSLKINSTEPAERPLKEKSTLVVPGEHFQIDHYLRLGYGNTQDNLRGGLSRVGD